MKPAPKFKVGDKIYRSDDEQRILYTITYVNKLIQCYELRMDSNERAAYNEDMERCERRFTKLTKLERALK